MELGDVAELLGRATPDPEVVGSNSVATEKRIILWR